MIDAKTHWSHIYQTKPATQVSWYQERPTLSLDLIQQTNAGLQANIIDVGAGASTLVDYLLAAHYPHLTLLDISNEALQITRDRLGTDYAAQIQWLVGDVTTLALPENTYDIWHDRAVFHFLTQPEQRHRYIAQVQKAVKPGGRVIIATFATDGPNQCSGLEVMQYDTTTLHQAFGADFALVSSHTENHLTPWATEQKFIYCYCRMAQST